MKFDAASLREHALRALERINEEKAKRLAEEMRLKAIRDREEADQIVERALVGVEHKVEEAVQNGRFHVVLLTVPENRRRYDAAIDLAWVLLEAKIAEMGLRPVLGIERVYDACSPSLESWVEQLEARWDTPDRK